MRISTYVRSEWSDAEQRYVVVEERGYEYDGPVARCDRSASKMAQNAGNQALGAANQYGSNAAAVGSFLVPQEQAMALRPPGYADLPNMLASAGANSAANVNRAEENARLRATRTGNAAGLGAIDAAGAQGGSAAETDAIQNILAQNAILKSQQQEGALGALGGLYGTDVRGQLGALGIVPEASKAMVGAKQYGWLQQPLGQMTTGALSGLFGALGTKAGKAGGGVLSGVLGGAGG